MPLKPPLPCQLRNKVTTTPLEQNPPNTRTEPWHVEVKEVNNSRTTPTQPMGRPRIRWILFQWSRCHFIPELAGEGGLQGHQSTPQGSPCRRSTSTKRGTNSQCDLGSLCMHR